MKRYKIKISSLILGFGLIALAGIEAGPIWPSVTIIGFMILIVGSELKR